MTNEQYINETERNCMTVLADCSTNDLLDVERLRMILWEDDRVTGVYKGYCTSAEGKAASNISDVLFDERFLKDFNEHGMDMQTVMAHGAEVIDVVARCLALKHISLKELVEEEKKRRIEKDRQARRNSVRA